MSKNYRSLSSNNINGMMGSKKRKMEKENTVSASISFQADASPSTHEESKKAPNNQHEDIK